MDVSALDLSVPEVSVHLSGPALPAAAAAALVLALVAALAVLLRRRRHRARGAETAATVESDETADADVPDVPDVPGLRALRAQVRVLEEALGSLTDPEPREQPNGADALAAYRQQVRLAVQAVAQGTPADADPRHAVARVAAAIERLVQDPQDRVLLPTVSVPATTRAAVGPVMQPVMQPVKQPVVAPVPQPIAEPIAVEHPQPVAGEPTLLEPAPQPEDEVVLPVPPPAPAQQRRQRRLLRRSAA